MIRKRTRIIVVRNYSAGRYEFLGCQNDPVICCRVDPKAFAHECLMQIHTHTHAIPHVYIYGGKKGKKGVIMMVCLIVGTGDRVTVPTADIIRAWIRINARAVFMYASNIHIIYIYIFFHFILQLLFIFWVDF